MKIRCSSLGKIMTMPRTKKDTLSATAKSYIKDIAKQDFYNYYTDFSNKYTTKGIEVEDTSIDLYNAVHFTNYEKNKERLNNEFLTGECDINAPDRIIDIKSSWSLETFPALQEDAFNKDYEWQIRGYMMLYNKPFGEIAYCMVSTPDELLNDWDNNDIHNVDHIEPSHRITVVHFTRELDKEILIEQQCKYAIEYYKECINQLNNK